MRVKEQSHMTLTNYRAVFGFIKYSRDKVKLKDYLERNEDAFSDLPGVIVDAIAELTDSSELKKMITGNNPEQSAKGDGVNMCEALRDWMEDLKNEALNEGRAQGLTAGMEKGIIEGRNEERKNTEMERQRADRAEERALRAEAELMKLKAQLGYA